MFMFALIAPHVCVDSVVEKMNVYIGAHTQGKSVLHNERATTGFLFITSTYICGCCMVTSIALYMSLKGELAVQVYIYIYGHVHHVDAIYVTT